MALCILGNIGSVNGLLPDDTKPLLEANVDFSLVMISGVQWHSLESDFTATAQTAILYNEFEKS